MINPFKENISIFNTICKAAVGTPLDCGVGRRVPERADLLDMAYINALPQPLVGRQYGSDYWWPIYDIEVQTGLVRIDVCGKLDVKHIGDFARFRDDIGVEHHADDFYADPESWVDREPPNVEFSGEAVRVEGTVMQQ